jgi:tRNA(fMet)-specific endonuclease VapC
LTYLLDSSVVIPVLRGRTEAYERHHARAVAEGRPVLLPSIVLHELWRGVERSSRPEHNRRLLERYLAGPVGTLAFDDDDAAEAGRVRSQLERAGTPIGPYDVLIAAQARRRSCTLATANVRAFGRVSGLMVEDWSA